MNAYAVIENQEHSFETDACYEDGYYDDYYEGSVTSTEYIAFFSNKKEADKCSKYLNDEQGMDTFVVSISINKIFNKEEFK